ncbi:hypothetical protein ACFL35_13190 [Candidatus Riflebacteria bacterium]
MKHLILSVLLLFLHFSCVLNAVALARGLETKLKTLSPLPGFSIFYLRKLKLPVGLLFFKNLALKGKNINVFFEVPGKSKPPEISNFHLNAGEEKRLPCFPDFFHFYRVPENQDIYLHVVIRAEDEEIFQKKARIHVLGENLFVPFFNSTYFPEKPGFFLRVWHFS